MPVTPFHFGPGAVVHAAAPRHVSFLAFCATIVLMDLEPLYYILIQQPPLHRFFHTLLGATVALLATVLIFQIALRLLPIISLPDLSKQLPLRKIVLGAALGGYSHILLDSIMHLDVCPFAPFSNANPLWRMVTNSTLALICLASGGAGIILLAIRYWIQARKDDFQEK
jgi:membrane-bound metal-dependent hydrolase YbcI (DUF457 family)